uniref:GPX4 peroxidase n=1 Tax=Dromaius novaehollandiae TaxID=8790 RepID=A0A8C4K1Y2_DRONO
MLLPCTTADATSPAPPPKQPPLAPQVRGSPAAAPAAPSTGALSALLQCAQADDWRVAKSIYDFHAQDIDGNIVSLEKYRGFVCIITNVASK